MKIPTLKFLGWIFLILWLTTNSTKAGELWLKDIPIAKLQEFYRSINYDGVKGYLMLPSHSYPAVFLKNFPKDYTSITDEAERNALFIKILTPLALKLNNELLKERKVIEKLDDKLQSDQELSSSDIKTIEAKATKYDVFSRLKGTERYEYLISELLIRIDKVPPSILITAAAIETNWGTSRIVKEGNSLYKTIVWHTDKGLKPIGETEDDSYRIKIYPDIYSSMQEFALKINSHRVFEAMRNLRRERRSRTSNINGLILAPYVYGSSQLENYAGLFDYTLAYYELLEIDKSSLTDNMIPKPIPKTYQTYVTKM